MRIMGRGAVVAAVLAVALAAGAARAENNPNGSVFRAVGWFKGKGDITLEGIKCEIPTISSAIGDGAFSMGLWNSFGFATFYFPDINHPFGDPCGGWMELQNNLTDQSIQVDRVELRYKIPGAGRLRQFVPLRNGFPVACRYLRRSTLFVGAVLNPINSSQDQSGSGKPNVSFIQMLPLLSTQHFDCLRAQYAALSPDLFSSLPIVIRATAVGTSDSGDTYRSNTIAYTLTARHTCGNARTDDGEECDPAAPNSCLRETCTIGAGQASGTCSRTTSRRCTSDADCLRSCTSPNLPEECVCVFPDGSRF